MRLDEWLKMGYLWGKRFYQYTLLENPYFYNDFSYFKKFILQ